MADIEAPGASPIWTLGSCLAGFMKGFTKTLLHTKYKSSWPHGFREEDFFSCFFCCKSMGDDDPLGRGQF